MTISKANKIRVRVEKVTEETAVGNGVAVGLVQGVIKFLDAYPALNRGQKVCRHFHFTGRSVGIFPTDRHPWLLELGRAPGPAYDLPLPAGRRAPYSSWTRRCGASSA